MTIVEKNLLFKKVKSNFYLRPITDGVAIFSIEPQYPETCIKYEYLTPDSEHHDIEPGDAGPEKNYYETISEELRGVVVGFKDVLVKANIAIDLDEYDRVYFYRHNKQYKRCAVVYYKANCKRYVPIEACSEASDG